MTSPSSSGQPGPAVQEYACTVEVRIVARSEDEARRKLASVMPLDYRLDAITETVRRQPGQPAGWPQQAGDQCGGG